MGVLSIWHLLVLFVVVMLLVGVGLVVWLVVRSASNSPAQTWMPPQQPNWQQQNPHYPQQGQPQYPQPGQQGQSQYPQPGWPQDSQYPQNGQPPRHE